MKPGLRLRRRPRWSWRTGRRGRSARCAAAHQLAEDVVESRRRRWPAQPARPPGARRTGSAPPARRSSDPPSDAGRGRMPSGRLGAGGGDVLGEGSGRALRRPGHQQGVVGGPGRTGRQHRRHPGPGPGGHQGQIGLVLDLLATGQGQGGSGVAVEEEPGRLGQQLGVGGVPAVDRHVDLARRRPTGEPADAPLLVGGRAPQSAARCRGRRQQDRHLVGRREPEG